MAIVPGASTLTRRLDLGVALQEWVESDMSFVARQVLTPVAVPRKNGTFSTIKRGGMLAPGNQVKRVAGSDFARGNVEVGSLTYACEERAWETPLDRSERENYRSEFDGEMVASRTSVNKVRLDQEIDVAALVFNTTTWTGSTLYTDNSGAPWATASSPIKAQILAAREKVRVLTGLNPNALIVSAATVPSLIGATDFGASLAYSEKAGYNAVFDFVAKACGLEKIIVAGGVQNAGYDYSTDSLSGIWSSTYAMVARVATSNSLDEPCIGRTFVWTDMDPAGGGGLAEVTVEQYREERKDSDIFRARSYCDELIFDASYAHLMKIA